MKKYLIISLFLFLSFAPLEAREDTVDIYFVGIGVNTQAQGEDDFAPDILEIEKILSNHPHDRIIKNLILGTDATKEASLEAFQWLQGKTDSNDIIIIYVSCHGTDTTRGYAFVPYNGYVYSKDIKKQLANLPGRLIMVLDTCHSGAMIRDWEDCGENVLIIAACKEKELSFNHDFFYAFISILESDYYDSNANKKIDTDELKHYLPRVLSQTTNRQHVTSSKSKMKLSLVKV